MECGGSDPTSGLAANPLVGEVADSIMHQEERRLVSEANGNLSGAEKLLAKRAVNAQVSAQILEIVRHYEDAMKCVNDDVRKRNPSPGNKAEESRPWRKNHWAAYTSQGIHRYRQSTIMHRTFIIRGWSLWIHRGMIPSV